MVFWLAVILLLVEMLCFSVSPVITLGLSINLSLVNYCCVKPRIHDATRCTTGCTTGCIVYTQLNADFMARYLSTVTSDETRSTHFAMELLCLREHAWEFSNNSTNSMSFSRVDEIDDLLSVVLY